MRACRRGNSHFAAKIRPLSARVYVRVFVLAPVQAFFVFPRENKGRWESNQGDRGRETAERQFKQREEKKKGERRPADKEQREQIN